MAGEQGKLPLVGKAQSFNEELFSSVPNVHSNDVRIRKFMVWNVIHKFG